MIKKCVILIFIFITMLSTVNSQYVYENGEQYISVDSILQKKTLSDLIYNITSTLFLDDKINITTINVPKKDKTKDYSINFITTSYAIKNNLSVENFSINYNGIFIKNYNNKSNQIFIVVDKILNDNYDWYTDKRKLLSNILIHELTHYYQHNNLKFTDDMINALNMEVTRIDDTKYLLHNSYNYTLWDYSDVPYILQNTMNMSIIYSYYHYSKYAIEIQARVVALCYAEKSDYNFYWDMIKKNDYNICNQYVLPEYVNNWLSKDFELIINNFYGAKNSNIVELQKSTPLFFETIKTLSSYLAQFLIKIFPFVVIISFISTLIGSMFLVFAVIKEVFRKK